MPLPDKAKDSLRVFIVQIFFSAGLLISAVYVLLKGGYDEATQKWAIGIIGLVLGYWLK